MTNSRHTSTLRTSAPLSLQEQLRMKLAQSEALGEQGAETSNPAPDGSAALVPQLSAPVVQAPPETMDAFVSFISKMTSADKDGDRTRLDALRSMWGHDHFTALSGLSELFQRNETLKSRFSPRELLDSFFSKMLHRVRELEGGLEDCLKFGQEATAQFDAVMQETWAIRRDKMSVGELLAFNKAERSAVEFDRLGIFRSLEVANFNAVFQLALHSCRGAATAQVVTLGLTAVSNAFYQRYRSIGDMRRCCVEFHAHVYALDLIHTRADAERAAAQNRSSGTSSSAPDSNDLDYLEEAELQHRAEFGFAYDAGLDTDFEFADDQVSGPYFNINGQPMMGAFDTFGNMYGFTLNDPW